MNNKAKVVIACISIIALIAIGAVIVMLIRINQQEPAAPQEPGNVYTMNADNYQQIQADIDAKVKDGYFETYMNTEWSFPDGTSETTDALLGNSPNNTKPIRCEVLLDDTGEKVYETGVLPVGTQVPPFKLTKDLDAGSYSATCMVYLMNEREDGTYEDASSAGFAVTLTIRK